MALDDLSHKRKTVSDLIRFIGNTSEHFDNPERIKTPNYSILLGAGASVTSGIRSGQTLINVWKEQVYKESNKDSNITLDEFFSSTKSPDWYEENNAYSALFENRYDLQRHRRIFVEHEVADKTPSIGYAYLVKLIEKGYFNTVFTTNFDDLLNEAFYRFSKNRPIVCAHDSSISGITVTSTRPKIIKLHGDYLFDDIKTTLRETESLEMNMKMKFQEFAKDFGLIVVGYAGHDRSIMDILTYLLQHEDYFKNGIYWCIRRKDTQISGELKKLLWRDRVYFVEIDGFDELFAEINHELNEGKLPIDDAFLSRAHQESIIKELTENARLNLDSIYLAEDCRKLKTHFEDNLANDFLKYIRNKKTEQSKTNENKRAHRKLPYPKLSPDEIKDLNDLVTEAFGLGHQKSVTQKLQSKDIFSFEDNRYKLELLELEADLIKPMSDDLVRKYFNELIRLNPENERYYEIAANRSNDIKQSLEYLSQAVTKFSNDYYIINLYISRLLDYCEDYSILSGCQTELDIIQKNINHSLELFPYIDNQVYTYQIRFYQLQFENNPMEKKAQYEKVCKELIKQSKHHPQTLTVLRMTKSDNLNEQFIKDALNYYKKSDNDNFVEKIYIELIKWYESQEQIDKIFHLFEDFEKNYHPSDNYKFVKANFLMEQDYLEDAFKIFKKLSNDREAINKTMTILSCLGNYIELQKLYDDLENKDDFLESYLNSTEKYDQLSELYSEKLTKNKYLTKNELCSYAYSLLKLEKYTDVMSLLKPYYDNPHLADGVIIVNYSFARMKLEIKSETKIKNKLKEKIFDNKFVTYSDLEKLGAACVINDHQEVLSYLKKLIKEKPSNKYSIKGWPVMIPFLNNPRISDLLNSAPKKIKK